MLSLVLFTKIWENLKLWESSLFILGRNGLTTNQTPIEILQFKTK